MKYIETEKRGPVLWIYLNRPTVKNAFNLEMGVELLKSLRKGMKKKSVSVIVLSSRGDSFSAGGDIKKMSQTKNLKGFFLKISKIINTVVLEMRKGPKPVIAAIPGYVGGIAFGFVLGTDIRIASTNAQFNAATIKIGLVANGGATYFLPRLTGLAKASEILLLGEVLSAKEALQCGLINRIIDTLDLNETVQEIAERLAKGPQKALSKLKQILAASETSSLPAQLERERKAIAWSSTKPDFKEGMTAFIQKRKPVFSG